MLGPHEAGGEKGITHWLEAIFTRHPQSKPLDLEEANGKNRPNSMFGQRQPTCLARLTCARLRENAEALQGSFEDISNASETIQIVRLT